MSHNIGGMAPFVSMPRGRNQMYYGAPCPGAELPPPHMQRGPCYGDEKMSCGLGIGEFKPPMMTTPEPPPPKKKRRGANNAATNHPPPPVMQDLLPPPLTGYGDTIVASNPFDDMPPAQQPMMHHGMHNGPMGTPRHLVGMHHGPQGGGACQMAGSPLNCGLPMGSPMACGMGSPIRSPMCAPQGMMCGPPQGSPMNSMLHRSPSLGSPVMGPPQGSPMECVNVRGKGGGVGSPMGSGGSLGPAMNCQSPMGSPLGNGGGCGGSPCGSGVVMQEMNRSPINHVMNMGSPHMMQNGPMGMDMCGGGMKSCQGGVSVVGGSGGVGQNGGGPPPMMRNSHAHMMGGPPQHLLSGSGNHPSQGMMLPHAQPRIEHHPQQQRMEQHPQQQRLDQHPLQRLEQHPQQQQMQQRMEQQQMQQRMEQQQMQQRLEQHPQQQHHLQQQRMEQHPQQRMEQHPQQRMDQQHMQQSGGSMHHPTMAAMVQHHQQQQHYLQHQGAAKPMPVSAGKVYPVDQPMVFNPQNPNAPPIYPCGICHKEVHDNDQAILCESGCNFWFHRVCTGLIEAAYQLLTAEVYAEWVCDKCLGSKNIPLVKLKP